MALKDVQPQDAACIIETDCNVDFDAPVGYKEPDYKSMSAAASKASSKDSEMRSSGCPSPATLSAASSATNLEAAAAAAGAAADNSKPAGTRIVNGKIVRPEDEGQQAPVTSMLAERIGTTGVQSNAAIPQAAPQVDYWAVNAGDGARLDGKTPSVLKDKDGTEVDIRKLRAEAAARRAEALAASSSSKLLTSSGKNLQGEEIGPDAAAVQQAAASSAPTSKRKTKVGSKFSRLKQSGVAFQGSANNLK